MSATSRLQTGSAFDPWREWNDHEGPMAAVAAAILAANPRNVQAWQFEVAEDRIEVFLDPAREEGALDPFHRELYVGLGCALENLVLAARANGYAPKVTLMPGDPGHAATVVLGSGTPDKGELYQAIPLRRTNRAPFQKRPIPDALLTEMAGLGDDLESSSLMLFADDAGRKKVGTLLIAATEEIVKDEEQSKDGYVWFRKSKREIEQHRDGNIIDTQGLARPISAIGKMLPRQSRSTADRFWLRQTRNVHTATAAAYGMIVVPDAADNACRVEGGRLLQRIHLFATARGLGLGHLNMFFVRSDRERQTGAEPRFTKALAEITGDRGEGLACFRLGYPTRPAAASPRRDLTDVVR
ncbi:hypothetical protein E1264_19915 [Actinomadura sp. KC216]|uniref:hypothetical protein n=1 Tax=Actinomadura sp. KC216 TaxID=2530370 RepID=UPI001044C8C5|nr:hypothetical protein [Actinomadura sp. KC216]TDB85800.1 hypothetical protein E1264_19915 [Actinomadura sp. KC216]